MHTGFPLWRPFQTSENPPEANAMSPSFETLSERMQERGRIVCKPQTLRRIRTLLLRRSRDMFGASKACAGIINQMGYSGLSRSAYLVEDVHEGQRIFALQRQCGVHALLRRKHPRKSIWELPRSYIHRHELGKEGIRILER